MEAQEPILIVCHGFPPVRGIGGRRWAKFAKELARRGHPVHVIRNAATPATLNSLWTNDALAPGIMHHPLPQRFPEVITKRPITGLRDKLMYRAWRRLLPLLAPGNYMDAASLWERQLLAEAGRLVRQHGIRNVIATGAPFHILAHAALLKEEFPQVHLVCDLRDKWTWGDGYGLGRMPHRRLRQERDLEARMARASDRLISPHATVIDHLHTTYGGPADKYAVIPHAVDPDDLDFDIGPTKDGTFRMLYAGSLYGAGEADQYFDALLDTFSRLRTESPEAFLNCRLDLYITGHGIDAYSQRVHDQGLGAQIRFHAPLPPKEIFNRIAASDLVLTFIPSMNKDILGTKFHEIFYLRRPILHIGEPGLVSRTLVERRLGDSVRVEELATELPRIIRGERKITVDLAADHSAYLLGPVTDRLINEVLA